MSRGPCSDCWTSLIHAYSLILRGMQAKPGLLNTQIIGQNVLETTFLQHTTRNQTWYLLSGCNTKLYMHTLSIYLSVLFTIMLKTSAWELLLFQQFNDWVSVSSMFCFLWNYISSYFFNCRWASPLSRYACTLISIIFMLLKKWKTIENWNIYI